MRFYFHIFLFGECVRHLQSMVQLSLLSRRWLQSVASVKLCFRACFIRYLRKSNREFFDVHFLRLYICFPAVSRCHSIFNFLVCSPRRNENAQHVPALLPGDEHSSEIHSFIAALIRFKRKQFGFVFRCRLCRSLKHRYERDLCDWDTVNVAVWSESIECRERKRRKRTK